MNGFDILALTINSIGCFLVGYFAGTKLSPKEEYDRMVKSIKKATTKSGVVTRPSPETVNLWSHPKEVEEQEAFKESFTKDVGDPTKV